MEGIASSETGERPWVDGVKTVRRRRRPDWAREEGRMFVDVICCREKAEELMMMMMMMMMRLRSGKYLVVESVDQS